MGWMLSVVGLLLVGLACTPEDEIVTGQEGTLLTFSQDTVQFDTVFTTVGSTTQWLRVYNPQRNAVSITSITLGADENSASPFRMVVNGEPGTQFQDVTLRGGDSLLMLVEVTVDPQNANLPFIVRDAITFRTHGNVQDVTLEAWGQDAYFIKSGAVVENTTFTAERPYVICDSLWVLPDATLTLEAGAQLYFGDDAYLLVAGTLQAEGTSDRRVLLQHVRDDGDYENAPGQWQGVFFVPNSQNNQLDFTAIRNANVGVSINSPDSDTIPDITLANTVIENMAVYGVYLQNTDVDVYNTVISNGGLGLIRGVGRGYYRFRHCTFVNERTSFASREDTLASLSFDVRRQDAPSQVFSLNILNSIIWGELDNELKVISLSSDRLKLFNTLVKSTDTAQVKTNFYNEAPQFVDSFLYDYRLDSLSPAIDAGGLIGIEKDLAGNPRDANPDLGAYEYVE